MTVLEPNKQAEILKNSPKEGQVATEEQFATLVGSSIDVWLSIVDGRFALNFSFPDSVGKWDYVALCDGNPGTNPKGYMEGQWQYISATNTPYVTGTQFNSRYRLWVIYVTWDYGQGAYSILAKSDAFR